MRTLAVNHDDALGAAARALGDGEVVLVPTDTVYGLAARPDDTGALQRIYLAKGRPDHVPLPILAASLDQVRQLGVEFSGAAETLAARWWPGPLTLAFGFSPTATRPPWLDRREEVAVRIPHNEFLLALIRSTGVLAVTSANRHGEPTPSSVAAAGAALAPHVALIVDAGPLDVVPSTLVNVRGHKAEVEREGSITTAAIRAALGHSA